MGTTKQIKTIDKVFESGKPDKSVLDKYRELYEYQPELTKELDNQVSRDFNQNDINEIVLWKVDRYAKFDDAALHSLNKIKRDAIEIDDKITKEILRGLLNTDGVGLPMASTILRFKNPNVYQIIDKRAYRFLYGKTLKDKSKTILKEDKKTKKYSEKSIEDLIILYIKYLEVLKVACKSYGIPFNESDRYLYTMDQKYNEHLDLKGKEKKSKS